MDGFRSTVLQRPRADSRTSQEDRERESRDRDSLKERDEYAAAAHDDRDRDRQRDRDILNRDHQPSSASASASASASHHQGHYPYSSPGHHHHQPAPAPPSIHHLHHPHHSHQHTSPPPSSHRSGLQYSSGMSGQSAGQGSPSAPSGGPVAPTLPPPAGLAPPPVASSATSPGGNHAHHAGVSPLHPPPAYYPPTVGGPHHDASRDANRDQPPSRSSFYDPTTDSHKDRRVSHSDTWQNAPQAHTPKSRDPYAYGQHEPSSYFNGSYTSPRSGYSRPRSPLSHSHPNPPAGSLSPPGRSTLLSSPTSRYNGPAAMGPLSNGSGMGHPPKSELAPPSPAKPAAASTPGRSADPMSFSNILSSSEPSKPREPSPGPVREPDIERQPKVEPGLDPADRDMLDRDDETEPEPTPIRESSAAPKKKARKATKGRASDIREQANKGRRGSLKRESPSDAASIPAKRPKSSWSPAMEDRITKREKDIDREASKWDIAEFDRDEYRDRALKRRKYFQDLDAETNRRRRDDFAETAGRKLSEHAECGRRRYDDVCYDAAHNEVRDQELHAEKERKKDMQRKRRREKSMAVTLEQKEAALARADAAEDEAERQKHLRDAERASKKAQQTQHILQRGIKGPARNIDVALEGGGTMSSFQASDIESASGAPTGKSKSKSNKSGNRPKKSKEQKQAEKDSAAAAQAAIDAGEELPARDEGKVRIKINTKGKKKDAKDKVKDADKTETDIEADKENKPGKHDKADDVPDLEKRFQSKGYNQIYDQILRDVARKDVNKTYRLASDSCATKASNLKKTAVLASKEAKRWQARTNKGTKDLQARAKRVMRDMMGFWKRNEREERDLRKAAEKQELENARKEEADREAARQKRKLNFLISQTELYSHFIGKKIKTDEVERSTDNPDIAPAANDHGQKKFDIAEPTAAAGKVTNFENLDFDDEDETNLQAAAMANAQNAIAEAQKKARDFNNQDLDMDDEGEMNFQNPAGMGDVDIEQPKLLDCQLKEYQLKGLNWLVNLYEQGINGILADEMGLGKTVQSISVMAYLAEKHDIWGPFLVVAPASTLHNWQQEIAKFVPEFTVLPYWGSAADRKILRKFWDRKHSTYRRDANFHVCVTSYQLVVSDVAYFQKMKWQYMILDEAQAIKSSQSSRWKSLLGFHCRNRLLLTGTPIQNNMQELWALLHFIMPSLFDSHDEFSEWFSKDIESHAQSNTKLNEDQLKRLHMILKPFMLRRVKKHVQKELGDKIEEDVFCDLTYRQRAYYRNLRNQINIMDLVEKATMGTEQDSGTLLNLVMQFRKVCNHPDLFERAEVTSSFSFGYFAETASFVREGNNVPVGYSTRNLIEYNLPARVWTEGGRLSKPGQDNQKAGWRNKALGHMMNIYSPEHISENQDGNKGFSWLRFADASPADVYKASHHGLFDRAAAEIQKRKRLAHFNVAYDEPAEENYTPAHAMFKICERKDRKPLAEVTQEGVLNNLMNVASAEYFESGLGRLEQAGRPQASAPPIEVTCNARSAILERENTLFNVPMRKTLYGPALWEEEALVEKKVPLEYYPPVKMLPEPDHEKRRFTNIAVPSMRRFVTDSGKLAKLDQLLFDLKNGGHRVLLYFQMTRMIDMMEEYLTYRNYKYCRLDGSTKLEDRRDTVHDFQTRPDIFVFLLSTRAGGLGINLTSADTVIFYDSDWNPTIDSQAMDRAHRLGQTKQVTVYRLITRGTIEERIRKRALQKEEVQRVVIQGGGASVDFSGRRAENRNKDMAMWLVDDEQAEMIEKREKELAESGELEKQKKKGGKKGKKSEAAASLEELYHEGEGHFDDASKQQSGTATPAEPEQKGKRAKKGTKRAKTTKQRLAIADGEV